MGRLHWYFFSYGQNGSYADNQATRIKASVGHFKRAAQDPSFERQGTAANYGRIAEFVSGIDAAVMQGDEDRDLYRDFWTSLQGLADQAREERVEIVKLDSCAFVANAIERYLPKFKGIGDVDAEEVEALMENVAGQLAAMDLTTEQNKELRDAAVARLGEEMQVKLDAVYGDGSSLGEE